MQLVREQKWIKSDMSGIIITKISDASFRLKKHVMFHVKTFRNATAFLKVGLHLQFLLRFSSSDGCKLQVDELRTFR
jgi:hypothetical protein